MKQILSALSFALGFSALLVFPHDAAAFSRGQICGYRCKITVTCHDGTVQTPEVSGCGFSEFEIQRRLFEVAEKQTCAAHGGWLSMHSLYCEHIRKPRTDWPNASVITPQIDMTQDDLTQNDINNAESDIGSASAADASTNLD